MYLNHEGVSVRTWDAHPVDKRPVSFAVTPEDERHESGESRGWPALPPNERFAEVVVTLRIPLPRTGG
jgi:hypothetical protein